MRHQKWVHLPQVSGEKIKRYLSCHRRDGFVAPSAKGSGDLNEFRRFMGMVSWQPLGPLEKKLNFYWVTCGCFQK